MTILKRFKEWVNFGAQQPVPIAVDASIHTSPLPLLNNLPQYPQAFIPMLLTASTEGIWYWDIANGNIYWSEQVQDIMGREYGPPGNNFDFIKSFLHPQDRGVLERTLRQHLTGKSPFSLEVRVRSHKRSYRHFMIKGKSHLDEQGKPLYMVGSIADVSSIRVMEDQIMHNAFHDALTKLPNRILFMERLEQSMEKSRADAKFQFAVLLVDVNHFKEYNDSFGHWSGDRILKELSKRLEACKRPEDTLARIGGNEFAFILTPLAHAGEAAYIAGRIQNEVMAPLIVDSHEVPLSASIGIVFNSSTGDHVEAILKDATTALHKAKVKGNNACEVFNLGMREEVLERFRLENELRLALRNGEITLSYQPIVRIHTLMVAGFEVLARWKNPRLGWVSPSVFIPIAEETGLIIELGDYILREACMQCKEWVRLGYSDVSIAVNFSGKQFLHHDLPLRINRVLRESGLRPSNLKMEITESVAINDTERVIQAMQRFSDMGIQISLDDFGTGYSSLSYLKKYPLHYLKVDRSFIEKIPENKEDQAITSTIIAMAKSLGLQVIAEGVGEEAQVDFLREKNCDYIQGYYFSKPLTPEDATKALLQQVPI
jgi:diguanylate cyclase (GGDEF)-like protein